MTKFISEYIVNWRLTQSSSVAHAWADDVQFRLINYANYSIDRRDRAAFMDFCELLQDAVTELDWDALVGASMDSELL